MWELMTGRMPFWDQNNDLALTIKICENFRPSIIGNAPGDYVELMQECWDSDPNKRPTTFDIIKRLNIMEKVEEENPTEIIKSSDIGPIITNNSDKIRPLSGIIKSAKFMKSSERQFITLTSGK